VVTMLKLRNGAHNRRKSEQKIISNSLVTE